MKTGALLTAAVVGFACVLNGTPVYACDCATAPTCESFWGAGLAFIGTVESITSPAPGTERVTLVVEEWLRGEVVTKELTIVSTGVGVSCDYDFSPHTRYLVFASKAPDGSWKAFLCGGTTPINSDRGNATLREIRSLLKSREPGQVSGQVAFDEDPAERIMPGAAIPRTVVRLQNNERTLTTKTDERGEFRFSRVPQGRYALSVALPANAAEVPPMQLVVGANACIQKFVFPHRRQ